MVQRAYPEDVIRRIPRVEEPLVKPEEVVKYVYVPQYYPTPRLQLDPNVALITFGIVVAVGLIALAVIYKK